MPSTVRYFWKNRPLNGLGRGQQSRSRWSARCEIHGAILMPSSEVEKEENKIGIIYEAVRLWGARTLKKLGLK